MISLQRICGQHLAEHELFLQHGRLRKFYDSSENNTKLQIPKIFHHYEQQCTIVTVKSKRYTKSI